MTSNDTASALIATLISSKLSPNAPDTILEPVNVVDGLFAIAGALDRVTTALYSLAETKT